MSLTRFWFDFDLDGHPSSAPGPGTADSAGATDQQQLLSIGAGVTGYGEEDALALLRDLVGTDLPLRIRTVTDGDADRAALRIPDGLVVGNAAWRGVWFPPG
ncbi:MAG TPA: hypothetical protein VGG07_26925 [Solirubrobacteraceae bacterium]